MEIKVLKRGREGNAVFYLFHEIHNSKSKKTICAHLCLTIGIIWFIFIIETEDFICSNGNLVLCKL